MASSDTLANDELGGLNRKNWVIAQALLGNASWHAAGLRIFLQRYFYFHDAKAGQATGLHSHDWFELSQILRGEVAYSDEEHTERFRVGDVFFMPASRSHRWTALSTPVVISSFQIKLSAIEAAGAPVLSALLKASSDHNFRLSQTRELRKIAALWWRELSESREQPLLREKLLGLFQLYFAEFLELAISSSLKDIRPVGQMPAARDQGARIFEMLEFLQQNLTKSVQIRDIADHFNYSVRHVHRLFLAQYGVPVGHYIRDQKLQLAQRLLAVSDDAIKNIAYQLGYSDPGHFSRVFRKHIAMSPAAYRETVRTPNSRPEPVKPRAQGRPRAR